MTYRIHRTPVGDYSIVVDVDGACTGLYRAGQRHLPDTANFGPRDDTVGSDVAAQLDEYFAGTRTSFDLNLAPQGTDFQRAVWAELQQIPYGATRSYSELASALGQPAASRAVGTATGRNPISIVIPCHRLLGSNGKLTGYAGGVETKAALLALENGQRPVNS